MNGTTLFLTILPFGLVAFMGLAGEKSYLEYVALGLCTAIVVFLCRHINSLTEKLDRKDKVLGELYERNTAAYHRLANLLEDRPCLMKDKRIHPDNERT